MNYLLSIFILLLGLFPALSATNTGLITLKATDGKEFKLSLGAVQRSKKLDALLENFDESEIHTEISSTMLELVVKVMSILDTNTQNSTQIIIDLIKPHKLLDVLEVGHNLDIPELIEACLDLYCQKINEKLSDRDYDLESLLGPLMVDEFVPFLSDLEHYNPGYTVDRNWIKDIAAYYMKHYGSDLDIPKYISLDSALGKFKELLINHRISINLKKFVLSQLDD